MSLSKYESKYQTAREGHLRRRSSFPETANVRKINSCVPDGVVAFQRPNPRCRQLTRDRGTRTLETRVAYRSLAEMALVKHRRPVFPVQGIDLTVNHPVTIHHDYYTICSGTTVFRARRIKQLRENPARQSNPDREEALLACRGIVDRYT